MKILNQKSKKLIIASLMGGYICVLYAIWQIPDSRFHIYFLDVGQGDAVFIKTPENHQILIDGGPDNFVIEEINKVMPFFDRSIDMVVLTHPDYDHVSGLVDVLKRVDVGSVLITGVESDNPVYFEFLKEAFDQEIDVFIAETGVDFMFGDVFIDVIYPFANISGQKIENVNNSSIAMKVYHDGHKVLLTGDLEEEVEKKLILSGEDLSADVYKAGHHGSKSSSTFEFLQMVKPELVVIQSGEGNKYGHPHAEVLKNFYRAGVEVVLRNDELGLVDLWF